MNIEQINNIVGDYSRQKTCAGFLTLRAGGGEETPEGFEPSWDICYGDSFDMIQAYEEEWEDANDV
jgi:hypothetical protein